MDYNGLVLDKALPITFSDLFQNYVFSLSNINLLSLHSLI